MESMGQISLKGHLLIAMPGMMDPNFSQSVTLICEHNASGAMGVIVDRVNTGLYAGDIFSELHIPQDPLISRIPVYHGGPVHPDEIFVVHGPPFIWDGCLMVTPTIALSNTMDLLTAIAGGSGPKTYQIVLGCAGWGDGQLEAELRLNAWLTCPATQRLVFETPAEERWKTAMNKMGVDPDLLSNTPGHA